MKKGNHGKAIAFQEDMKLNCISKRVVKAVISLTDACLAVIDRTSAYTEFGAYFGLPHTVHIAVQDSKFQSREL